LVAADAGALAALGGDAAVARPVSSCGGAAATPPGDAAVAVPSSSGVAAATPSSRYAAASSLLGADAGTLALQQCLHETEDNDEELAERQLPAASLFSGCGTALC
jgi:hypothetical protein